MHLLINMRQKQTEKAVTGFVPATAFVGIDKSFDYFNLAWIALLSSS